MTDSAAPMMSRSQDLVLPPDAIRYRRRLHVVRFLRELWRARPLVRSLVEREIRGRYKQALLGAAWAFIAPVGLVVVLSVFFQRVADVDTNGVPYVLFSYVALIPWGFFAGSMNGATMSLVGNIALLNKIACPREVFPIAAVAVAAFDSIVSALVLPVFFMSTGYAPRATAVWVPLLLGVQIIFVLGVALLVSSLVVYLRDLRHAMGMIVQFALFATPVAYGLESVARHLHRWFALFNPLSAVIDGYRRTILYGQMPRWDLLALASASSVVVLTTGYVVFKRLETGIADVV